MERKTIFLIVGSTLLVTAIGIGLYLIFNKPSDKDEKNEDKKGGNDSGGDDDPTEEPPPSKNPAPTNQSSIQNGKVVPVFNEENELKNEISQLKATLLYPKREWQGGLGYTNVRTSAEVDTGTSWYDLFGSNLLTTIGEGTPIGKVTSETTELYNSHPYRWFKVKLNKPVGFWGTDVGYVRADTVTFVPYTKK